MQAIDSNRLLEMEVFVRAVELSSFSAVARLLHKSPSAISKLITRLERRLKVQLLNRSTRQLQLTAEGGHFYHQCVDVLAALEQAEQSVLSQQKPAGRLRVSCSIPVGRHFILPLVPQFLDQYPGMQLDIDLTDRVVNLIDEYTDVAIRSGPMKSSNLRARTLFETDMVFVASPDYISAYGKPTKMEHLKKHRCCGFNFSRAEKNWMGSNVPAITCSDGESLRQCVLAGGGVARLAHFQVAEDIDAGRLVWLMRKNTKQEAVHAVFLGQGNHMPARIRVFLDFMLEHVK